MPSLQTGPTSTTNTQQPNSQLYPEKYGYNSALLCDLRLMSLTGCRFPKLSYFPPEFEAAPPIVSDSPGTGTICGVMCLLFLGTKEIMLTDDSQSRSKACKTLVTAAPTPTERARFQWLRTWQHVLMQSKEHGHCVGNAEEECACVALKPSNPCMTALARATLAIMPGPPAH